MFLKIFYVACEIKIEKCDTFSSACYSSKTLSNYIPKKQANRTWIVKNFFKNSENILKIFLFCDNIRHINH